MNLLSRPRLGRYPALAAFAGLMFLASPTWAASSPPESGTSTRSVPELRLYAGMWSTHIRDFRRGLRNNWLVGLGWRGFYAGTFINSFGNRSFTAGIYRDSARTEEGGAVPFVGYRLGVVSGYDERFMRLASKTPVLPLVQVLGGIQAGPTGLEVGYAGLVATLGPSLRF